MSTFKFACPNCGQHISVDKDQAGARMECPTCFQNIVVPQAPEEGSKFVLTGAKVNTRVIPTSPDLVSPVPIKKTLPIAAISFVVILVVVLGVGFIFRGKLFKHAPKETQATEDTNEQATASAPPPPPAPVVRPNLPFDGDTNWTMNLTNIAIPTDPMVGRINGLVYTNQRAQLVGGWLNLRQGNHWPPDLGLSVFLNAAQGEDLAGRSVKVAPEQMKKGALILRWKDPGQDQQRQLITNGYALRVDFGPLVSGRIAGRIYLCAPDDYKSWVAGTFTASIRKPRASDPP